MNMADDVLRTRRMKKSSGVLELKSRIRAPRKRRGTRSDGSRQSHPLSLSLQKRQSAAKFEQYRARPAKAVLF
jgi:hypothetical protein